METTYSPEIGNKICKLTATSTIGLRHICNQVGLPYSTVTDWIYDRDHDIYLKYKKAKLDQLEELWEEVLELRHNMANDFVTVEKNGKSIQVQNREALACTRLKISSALMLITRLKPIMDKEIHELQKHRDHDKPRPPRIIPDTPHARRAMEMGPTIYHTGESVKTMPSTAPGNTLKPATSLSLFDEDTQHTDDNALPKKEPAPQPKMGRRDLRIAMLKDFIRHKPGDPGFSELDRLNTGLLQKELNKTKKEIRLEELEDIKNPLPDGISPFSPDLKWKLTPDGHYEMYTSTDREACLPPYRWG